MQVLKDSVGAIIPVDKSVKRPLRGGGRRTQHHTQLLAAVTEFAEGAKEVLIINRNNGQVLFVNGTQVATAVQHGQYFQSVEDPEKDGLPTLEVTGTALSFDAVITY